MMHSVLRIMKRAGVSGNRIDTGSEDSPSIVIRKANFRVV